MSIFTLQDICKIEKGKQIDTSTLDELLPYRYINGGIKESGYYKDYNIDGETILISEGGASCGYISYIDEKIWHGCHCYALTNFKILPKYLFYALKANQTRIMALRTGAAMPNIKKTTLQNMQLKLHDDISIQTNIITILDNIDMQIINRASQLEKLDVLVKSRFVEMFGDPVVNPMGWEQCSVDSLCEKIVGGGTPSKSIEKYYKGNIPWVTPKDMKNIYINNSIDNITVEATENSSAKLVPTNSVLMVIRSGILKRILPVAVNIKPVTINQDMKAFIPNDKVNNIFLLYSFMLWEKELLSNVRSVTADNIEFSIIKNLMTISPPCHIQNKFADFVKQVDKSKFEIKQSLEKLETLQKSLMQEYFG